MAALRRLALMILVTALAEGIACSRSAPPTSTDAAARMNCGALVDGADEVLQPGHLTLFGEIHGTMEAPQFVAKLACLGAIRGKRVLVGLEISRRLQPLVEQYVRSAGTMADRAELLRAQHWESPDGRGSVAMVTLLDALHELASVGGDVRVFFFDGRCGDSGWRDPEMAECIAEELSAEPNAVALVLTGNLHARSDEPVWMGWYLLQRYPSMRSYNFASDGGTAWGCTSDCGPHELSGGNLGGEPRIIEFAMRDERGFDGLYFVGRATAAAPVRPPADLSGSHVASPANAGPPPERGAAEQAYAAKEYAECAKLYRLSAKRNSGEGAGNDMYDAACCEALGGRSEAALATLGEAINMGFSNRMHLESDPDLSALHALPGWSPLVARIPVTCGP